MTGLFISILILSQTPQPLKEVPPPQYYKNVHLRRPPVRIYKKLFKAASNPDSVSIYGDSAYYYWNKKDYKKAKYFFEKLMKFKPAAAYYYTDYGYFLLEIGETGKAIKIFKKVLKKFPYNEDLLLTLFDLYEDNVKEKRKIAERVLKVTLNDSIRQVMTHYLETTHYTPFTYSFYWGTYYTARENFIDSDTRLNIYLGNLWGIKPLAGVRFLYDSRSGRTNIYEDDHIFTYLGLAWSWHYLISIFAYYGYYKRVKIWKPVMEGTNYQLLAFLSKDWIHSMGKLGSLIFSLYSEINYEKRVDNNVTLDIETNTGYQKKFGKFTLEPSIYFKFLRDRRKLYYNNLSEIGPEIDLTYVYWLVFFTKLVRGYYAGIESGEPNPYNSNSYWDFRIGFYIAR